MKWPCLQELQTEPQSQATTECQASAADIHDSFNALAQLQSMVSTRMHAHTHMHACAKILANTMQRWACTRTHTCTHVFSLDLSRPLSFSLSHPLSQPTRHKQVTGKSEFAKLASRVIARTKGPVIALEDPLKLLHRKEVQLV